MYANSPCHVAGPRPLLESYAAQAERAADLRRPWERLDSYLATFLGAFATLSRIPFASKYLNTWDSVLFALGMSRYNVIDARPHPPGYPVYIALAKMLHPFFGEENQTLIAISILSTAASAMLLFGFMRQFGNRRSSFAGAFLFLMAPVFLFNGAIATSYPGEAFFTIATAWAAWRVLQSPTPTRLVTLGATYLLSIGFRQSMLFFLTPLVAYALLRNAPWKARLKRTAIAGAAGLATGLAWLIPMVQLSGGFQAYRQATSLQTGLVVFEFTVFNHGKAAWLDHWNRFQLYIQWEVQHVLWAVLLAIVIAGTSWLLGKRISARMDLPKGTLLFMTIWVLPAIAFYLLIFNGWGNGPPGYILIVLPALYALMAWTMDWGVRALEMTPRPKVKTVLTCLAPFLLISPAIGLATEWGPVTQKEIKEHDQWTENWLQMNEELDPNTTAILSSYSWAHVKWHHPEFIHWSFLHIPQWDGHYGPWVLTMETQHREEDHSFYEAHFEGPTGRTHAIPIGLEKIVLFDFQLAGEQGSQRHISPDIEIKEGFFENGWRYLYIEPEDSKMYIEDYLTPRPNEEIQ